jgi:hypothetical protein
MSTTSLRLLGSGGVHVRNDNDYYPTPPFVANILCRHFDVPHKVWEPAAGRGWMAKEFIRNGHSVVASELYEYDNALCDVEWNTNFLSCEKRDADAIITNPPYEKKLPLEFAQRALSHDVTFVAMLCRLLWVEAQGRHEFFTTNPPSDILMLAGRFSCTEEKLETNPLGGMVSYAWFVWDKRVQREATHFKWAHVTNEYQKWKTSTSNNIESFIE